MPGMTKKALHELLLHRHGGDEPVEDSLGGVALLARRARVGLEDGADQLLVAPERRPPALGGQGRDGRHVLHVGVLRDGVAADVEPSRYLGARRPVGVHRPYIIPHVQGHGPRALSALFLMTAILKKQRPFGPLPSEHQQ